MFLVVALMCAAQYSISISLNPKRMAGEQSCAEAKNKCCANAKKDEAKKAAYNVAYDKCIQKYAKDFHHKGNYNNLNSN